MVTTTARVVRSAIGLAAMIAAAPALAADGPGVDAKAAFARFKALEGEWKAPAEGPEPGCVVVYRVISHGSVVMETLGPGTTHEMVTMYHLDGGDLKMTHYCAVGNQPRLKLDTKASTPDDLKFAFDGGSNIDPAVDLYMSEVRFLFRDGTHLESTWGCTVGGKKGHSKTFFLSRP